MLFLYFFFIGFIISIDYEDLTLKIKRQKENWCKESMRRKLEKRNYEKYKKQ